MKSRIILFCLFLFCNIIFANKNERIPSLKEEQVNLSLSSMAQYPIYLKNILIFSSNDKYFNIIKKEFSKKLQKESHKFDFKLYQGKVEKKPFDAILTLNFKKDNDLLYCYVKLVNINSLRGYYTGGLFNSNLLIYTINIKQFEKHRTSLIDYMVKKISKKLDIIAKFRSPYNPSCYLSGNKLIKINLNLPSLKNAQKLGLFPMTFTKELIIWNIKNKKEFLNLMDEAKQIGFQKNDSWGEYVNGLYGSTSLKRKNQELLFSCIASNDSLKNPNYYLTYSNVDEKEIKDILKKKMSNNFLEFLMTDGSYLILSALNSEKLILDKINLDKVPISAMSNIFWYIKTKDGLLKVCKAYEKKLTNYYNEPILFKTYFYNYCHLYSIIKKELKNQENIQFPLANLIEDKKITTIEPSKLKNKEFELKITEGELKILRILKNKNESIILIFNLIESNNYGKKFLKIEGFSLNNSSRTITYSFSKSKFTKDIYLKNDFKFNIQGIKKGLYKIKLKLDN